MATAPTNAERLALARKEKVKSLSADTVGAKLAAGYESRSSLYGVMEKSWDAVVAVTPALKNFDAVPFVGPVFALIGLALDQTVQFYGNADSCRQLWSDLRGLLLIEVTGSQHAAFEKWAEDVFVDVLVEAVALCSKYTEKLTVRRFLGATSHAKAFLEVRARMDRCLDMATFASVQGLRTGLDAMAKCLVNDLHKSATQLAEGTAEDIKEFIDDHEGRLLKTTLDAIGASNARLAAEMRTGFATVLESTESLDDKVAQLLAKFDQLELRDKDREIERHTSFMSQTSIDKVAYADAVTKTFGKMLHLADVMDANEGTAFRQLGLHDVYVEQFILECDEIDASNYQLPVEYVQRLRDTGQLDVAKKDADRLYDILRLYAPKGNKPVSSEFGSKVIPLDFIFGDPGASKIRTLREAMVYWSPADAKLVYDFPVLDAPKEKVPVSSAFGSEASRLTVILGDPGAGKTSTLREEALRWSLADAHSRDGFPFPVLIELKQYAEAKGQSGLKDYVVHGGSVHLELKPDAVELLLTSSSVVVMLDGLDEVFDSDLRNLVVADILTFANCYKMNKNLRIIVTSRVIGYKMSQLPDFKHYMLQPLESEQMSEFIEKWHTVTYSDVEADVLVRDIRRERLKELVNENPSVGELARNPLLLTMMAIVNRSNPEMPTQRAQLYEKCASLLVSRWKIEDAVKSVAHMAGKDIYAFGENQKIAILCDLALAMHQDETKLGNLIAKSVLEEIFERHVELRLKRTEPALASALILQVQLRHGILCFLGGLSYAFVHRTFLEYFSALAISNQLLAGKSSQESLEQLFVERGNDETWHEVLCLICGILPSLRLSSCLMELSKVDAILAARCIEHLKDRHEVHQAEDAARKQLEALFSRKSHQSHILLIDGVEQLHNQAMNQLLRTWPPPDPATRKFLETLAKSEGDPAPVAIRELRAGWPDEATRAFLVTVALSVKEWTQTRTALEELRAGWQDEETRPLLEKIALTGEDMDSEVLRGLLAGWPDVGRAILKTVVLSNEEGVVLLAGLSDAAARSVLEDIGLVMNQAGASAKQATKALSGNHGDVVSAIMQLATMQLTNTA